MQFLETFIRKILIIMKNKKIEFLLKAKFAAEARRYDDMIIAIKSIIEIGAELTKEERYLLSLAYKSVIGTSRKSWKTIKTIEENISECQRKFELVREYKQRIEKQIRDICYDLIDSLDLKLIPSTKNAESRVFYYKMKGDCYRYLSEIANRDKKYYVMKECEKAYDTAFKLSETTLLATHPFRLSLVLNYSVFYYEILCLPERACEFARKGVNDALIELHDPIYKDSLPDTRLLMQILMNNVLLWTPNEGE